MRCYWFKKSYVMKLVKVCFWQGACFIGRQWTASHWVGTGLVCPSTRTRHDLPDPRWWHQSNLHCCSLFPRPPALLCPTLLFSGTFWYIVFSTLPPLPFSCSLLSHTVMGLSFKALLGLICCYFFFISQVIVKIAPLQWSWPCCFYLCFSEGVTLPPNWL